MEWIVLLVVAALAALAAVGGYAYWARQQAQSAAPPPRAWKGDTVTPVILGPRNRAPERVARGFVASQGALLAMNMANADGQITEVERDAIRSFILKHVTNANEMLAEKALQEAEEAILSQAKVDAAVEAVRAVGSEEQRQLLVDLLVHVAQADGQVKPEEVAFMQRVGNELGLSEADVKARIALT
ncbi:MAG: TerB family tellurite resistance protein [Alphaproteobacteria bacterium]|nr:TerB family tellurite resistance protein [Alphaproteobacteria bacterium]